MNGRTLVFDKNAVSELVGYIILLSIVITAIGIIYVISMPDLLNSQDQAQFQNIEQAFTVLDTHASKSQYSNYLSQMTEMDLKGGSISIDDSSKDSFIAIYFLDGTQIYNGTLGTIKYSIDGKDIGYQAGGIWEKYPDNGSVMVSAPDFNFNGVTLTLPLMQLKGNGSTGGTGKAIINTQSQTMPIIVYPNLSLSSEATNPVTADQVFVKIRSDYYIAWANYINKRTEAAAVPYENNKTVIVTFNTKPKGTTKPFTPPIPFRGVNTSNDHPIKKFNLNLSQDHPGANIDNLNFDLRAPSANSVTDDTATAPALHISIQRKNGKDAVYVIVEYADINGVERFTSTEIAINKHDNAANLSLIDYTVGTTYSSTTPSWTWTDEGHTYINGNSGPNLGDVIQHYIVVMSEEYPMGFSLYYGNLASDHTSKNDKGENQWPDVPPSTYTLDYDSKNVLTYLHVTNNPINVTIS